MAMYTSDTAYDGEETIVISLDIGTTHSAATFSHVYPGDRPDVRSILKWPGQEDAAGDSKIPTILAYQNGEAKFCGAEAFDYLEDDEYEIARWFKLHLHPESMKISDQPPAYGATGSTPCSFEIPELPKGVSLEKVYTDFIKYVYNAARNFFVNGTPNGLNIWNRLRDNTIIVLCTPNGWDISQHTFLRKVVIRAGLVTESDADQRLEFITEGEASVHYALAHTKGVTWLSKSEMFMVTDAGGSTVDSTLYECKSTSPLLLEEVCASECVQAGGVFVDRAAHTLLTEMLRSSRFGSDEWVPAIVRAFERKTKRIFDGSQLSNVMAFGGPGDNDRANGILKGKISLSKQQVGSAFEDVVTRTVDSCLKLLRGRKVQHLLLVGGFGESPYLRGRLRQMFRDQGTEVVTVEEPSKKAAAEGATIWFIKQLVKARAARCTYGIELSAVYSNALHAERSTKAYVDHAGTMRIQCFEPIIKKDFVLSKDWQKINDYCWTFRHRPPHLGDTALGIFAWEKAVDTIWLRDADGGLLPGMRLLCVLRANMTGLQRSLTMKVEEVSRESYYQLHFQVAMSFKRGKLQAKLMWKELGQTREGPVSILPESTF